MIEGLILLTLWLSACVGAFLGGYRIGKSNRHAQRVEKRISDKERRELENFWAYNGTAQ